MSLAHKLAISGTWLSALAFVLFSGCGGSGAPPRGTPEPARNACALGRAGAQSSDTISILLDLGAGPEFVAEQQFESLIRIDCEGHLVPGLAQSWQASGDGSWRVVLRSDVHFWGGERLTSRAVVESWSAARADSERTIAPVVAASSQIVDDHTLIARPPSGDITTLADRRLAVIAPGAGGAGEGTGAFRAMIDANPNNDWTLLASRTSSARPVLRVSESSASAMRDSLDAGAEIVVSKDASVVRYGAESPSVTRRLLPWSSRYVLITTRAFGPLGAADSTALAGLGVGLASDAVRADARSAYSGADMNILDACLAAIGTTGGDTNTVERPAAEIVYDRADPVARSIAERLVALSTINGGQALGPLRSVLVPRRGRLATRDLSRPAFAASLASRSSVAYVLSLPLGGAGSCSAVDELSRAAPWLQATHGSDQIVALVDVRAALLVRQGAPSLVIGAGGSVLVAPVERGTVPNQQ